ncbi:MAG: substrate-binding domain-containing protein [Bacteroidetes bacterium]|nr:substrate-binding domain-containing protein [Bacteroidota bacterium]
MIFRLAFLILTLFPLITGCGGNAGKKNLKIAVVPKGKTHIFWKSVRAGAMKAAHEHKINILWESPEKESDRQTQIQIVQGFISQNVDALVLAPLDSRSLVPVVKSVNRREIPVIIFDSDLASEDYVSFVATNNYRGGGLCAEIMAEKLEEKGRVAILRFLEGSASTTNREQGFLDRMRQIAPEVNIVSSDRYAGATFEEAVKAAEQLLSDFPKLKGVYTPNETTTYAMLEALKKTGKTGTIKFVGFDSNDSITPALEAGHIDALALQDPFQMGYEAVIAAIKTANGEEVDRRIETRIAIATHENLSSPDVQTLLHPDIDKWLKTEKPK